MSTDTSVTKIVAEFVAMKEEVTAAEIAAFLITVARQEGDLDDETYEAANILKALLWRGATTLARDVIKKPSVVEAILDEAQADLFEGLGGFVRIGNDADGGGKFKRRRALTREEYEESLLLLRATAQHLAKKIERYQGEYDKALPFWAPGLTFGEAFQAASEGE